MKLTFQIIVSAMLFAFFIGGKPPDQFPSAEITNGLIRARLYLPDNKEGYYRGSRFDWSGVMPELEFEGHTYFGQWFPEYSPTLHDAILGPVEYFSPVGYEETKTGETFLKVGVGMVKKVKDEKYFFANFYPIVNGGSWHVKKKRDQVTFVHRLEDKEYAYEYVKVVQLVKGKGEMILSHSLRNRGKRNIESATYNHNFFVMDNQPIGKDFVITFPFKPIGDAGPTKDFGAIQDNQIVFLKELKGNDHLQFRTLEGYGNSAKDYDIRIENHKTGAAVRITADQPLSKLAFWSAATTVCPEPFIQLKVKPGETFAWKIFYQFYTCDIKSN